MAYFEVKTKGQKAVLERMDTILKTPYYTIEISNKPTLSIYYKTVPGTKGTERQTQPYTKKRSAGQNTTILRTQAKKGRNVIYLKPAEKKPFDELIGNAIHAINKKLSHDQLIKATDKIGKELSKLYASHIKENRGFKGKLKPNTRGTFFRKLHSQSRGPVNDSLRTRLTPMIESGELMKSFIFRVKKVLRGPSNGNK